jgi:hypothetical protein
MEVMHTMPELGFQKKATDAAFASNVLETLDDIYNSRNVSLALPLLSSSGETDRLSFVAHLPGSRIEAHRRCQ